MQKLKNYGGKNMIYGEILAGGSGNRMGNTEMPKQYLMLGDRTINIHKIEQFLIN